MTFTYKVLLDCANCADHLEYVLKRMEGVADAQVNFLMGKLKVVLEDGTKTELVQRNIEKAIDTFADSKKLIHVS